MKKKAKILFPLFGLLLSIFGIHVSAEQIPMPIREPLPSNETRSNAVSVSGISSYSFTDNKELEIPLEKIPKSVSTNSEAFIPRGVSVEPMFRQIIGVDNRTRVTNTTSFPNSAIGQMVITFPNNKQYVGTTWMEGNKVAVTAGHTVYSKADGGWAKRVVFYPGRNGGLSPLGVYYATQLYTDTKYVASENSNYDWGMLRFATNVGAKTGYFGAEWTSSSQVGLNITVRGYPGEKSGQLWTASGNITGQVGYAKTNYLIDTTGGQSGAPAYYYVSGNYRAVGIHTNSYSSYNQAQRIDSSLFKIINNARSW
ncbi:trypsin-like serine peptidase [Lactococcus ileimucosae]|uniref:trypsin-like serine peptidase n=1 Tax=Lactococcus ileimucosae TaxID=2941329 RepID=UPI0035134EA9